MDRSDVDVEQTLEAFEMLKLVCSSEPCVLFTVHQGFRKSNLPDLNHDSFMVDLLDGSGLECKEVRTAVLRC